MALPSITAIGNLVADPELRFTASGVALVKIRIACSDRRKNPETGQWEDGDSTFLSISAWRQMAENAANSLTKGDKVIVSGRLKSRTVENADGSKTTYFEVDADSIAAALDFATVTVKKIARTYGNESSPATDPWASSPLAPDEAPF